VPREVVERRIMWGTPGQVARQLAQLVEAGLRAVSLLPLSIQTPRLAYQTLWTSGRMSARAGRASPETGAA
jgi:hypothetical protein